MLIRTQLALPGYELMEPDVYNQVFTMHGTVMMFLFAVPMMEGLAVYLIPKMIGARDLVFRVFPPWATTATCSAG